MIVVCIAAYLIVTVTKAHSLTEAKYAVKQGGKYIKKTGNLLVFFTICVFNARENSTYQK